MSDFNRHGDGVCHIPCSGDESISCGETEKLGGIASRSCWSSSAFEVSPIVIGLRDRRSDLGAAPVDPPRSPPAVSPGGVDGGWQIDTGMGNVEAALVCTPCSLPRV